MYAYSLNDNSLITIFRLKIVKLMYINIAFLINCKVLSVQHFLCLTNYLLYILKWCTAYELHKLKVTLYLKGHLFFMLTFIANNLYKIYLMLLKLCIRCTIKHI